jgi:hypothetical protein
LGKPLGLDTTTLNHSNAITKEIPDLYRKESLLAVNTPGLNVCLMQGSVLNRGQEYDARILIDSGASQQYVSSDFARKASMELDNDGNEPSWVQIADGSIIKALGQAIFTLALNRYRTRVTARVLEMPEYDIILGFEWLRVTNPIIDWEEMRIQIREGGELYELFPKDTLHTIHTKGNLSQEVASQRNRYYGRPTNPNRSQRPRPGPRTGHPRGSQ